MLFLATKMGYLAVSDHLVLAKAPSVLHPKFSSAQFKLY